MSKSRRGSAAKMNKSNVCATGKGVAATYGSTSLLMVCAVVFLAPALLQMSKDEPECGPSLPHVRANCCSRSAILHHSASLQAQRLLPSRACHAHQHHHIRCHRPPPHRPPTPHAPAARSASTVSQSGEKSAGKWKFNFKRCGDRQCEIVTLYAWPQHPPAFENSVSTP